MYILLLIISILIVICVISVIVCHYSIKISRYSIKSEKITSEFNGFKIVHLSDLHSRVFGKDNAKFVSMIQKENPDIIVMTGDMINGKYNDIVMLEKLIQAIRDKCLTYCSIYYIMGNREFRYSKENYIKLKDMLKSNNVIVLENAKDEIKIENKSICIYGLNYYNRDSEEYYANISSYMKGKGKETKKDITSVINRIDTNKYKVLLVHDPNNFKEYSSYGFDLVLAGHIHGGVIRIPLVGGLLSPEIKLFPKYDGGIFAISKSTMCVSKGLGYGTIPFRLFNKPEIVSIKLVKE